MAEFSLNIKTESTQELLDIVSRINGCKLPGHPMYGKSDLEIGEALHADGNVQAKAYAAALPERHNIGSKVPTELPDVTPERDAHGIKYDERIHPGRDSASLFKGDNTWRKRRGVADEQYEEIYLELAREARAAGLYTGPAIPELELESRVGPFYWVNEAEGCFGLEETLDELNEKLAVDSGAVEIDEARYTKIAEEFADALSEQAPVEPMPAPVAPTTTPAAPTPVAPAPVTPAPTPAPAAPTQAAPAPGMSAEDTPTPVKAVQALVAAAGPMAAHSLFKAFGVTAAPDCTPQQLRDMVAIAEKLAATLPPAEKMTRGQEALANVALEFGYIVQ